MRMAWFHKKDRKHKEEGGGHIHGDGMRCTDGNDDFATQSRRDIIDLMGLLCECQAYPNGIHMNFSNTHFHAV